MAFLRMVKYINAPTIIGIKAIAIILELCPTKRLIKKKELRPNINEPNRETHGLMLRQIQRI